MGHEEPTVIRGFLGWGNRKVGLEAYGPDGRWGGEKALGDNRGFGDLLGDALDRCGVTEGAELIVVAVPRRMLMADREAGDKIHSAVVSTLELRQPQQEEDTP